MLQSLWLTDSPREQHPGLLSTVTQNKRTGLISVEMTESRKEARLYPEISINLCVIVGGRAALSEFLGCLRGGFTEKATSA